MKTTTSLSVQGQAGFAIQAADLIAGLGRGLAVIAAFTAAQPRQTVGEVAAGTGIPRTAARRYLLSLCHFGYMQTDGKRFWLSPRVLRLGNGYLESARLPRVAQPFIQRLSAQVGEVVNVSVLDGHEVVYVARSTSARLVSTGFDVGTRVQAQLVTPGPVLLSALAPGALARWMQSHAFDTQGARAMAADDFGGWVQAARRQGYWITEGMLDPTLAGVAVRLTDARGEVVGALSMTLQLAHWPRAQMERVLVPALLDTARQMQGVL